MYIVFVNIYPHTHTQTHLCAVKIKRHLLRWHLLQSHTPPPLLHPSCHNCKNSTNTHAHSRIFTLTHTHHFSCSHLFPLTMALSSWCPCAHSLPQLACNVCECVFMCVYDVRNRLFKFFLFVLLPSVPAELRPVSAPPLVPQSTGEKKWTVSHA